MPEARITPRSEDYSQWYQDVISQAQLAEPANVVKGCMVIRPHGFAIWEAIQGDLDKRFKATGHKNASRPRRSEARSGPGPVSFRARRSPR